MIPIEKNWKGVHWIIITTILNPVNTLNLFSNNCIKIQKMPVKISIITVCYNNKYGLEKTIHSIKDQTYKEFEFIIIDGASTDGTLDFIVENKHYISTWISEKDNGIYHAMNKGILLAKGEYCIFLNSGDCLANNKVLENIVDHLIEEDIIYGNVIKVKPHYRRLIKYSSVLSLYDFYRTTAAIHHQASFIKRELFEKYGLYREDLKINGDWEFFFRMIIIEQVKTKYFDMVISVVDGSGLSNNMKKDNPLRLNACKDKENILKSNFPEYILTDYQKLDHILSHCSFFQRIINKTAYFRLKK